MWLFEFLLEQMAKNVEKFKQIKYSTGTLNIQYNLLSILCLIFAIGAQRGAMAAKISIVISDSTNNLIFLNEICWQTSSTTVSRRSSNSSSSNKTFVAIYKPCSASITHKFKCSTKALRKWFFATRKYIRRDKNANIAKNSDFWKKNEHEKNKHHTERYRNDENVRKITKKWHENKIKSNKIIRMCLLFFFARVHVYECDFDNNLHWKLCCPHIVTERVWMSFYFRYFAATFVRCEFFAWWLNVTVCVCARICSRFTMWQSKKYIL